MKKSAVLENFTLLYEEDINRAFSAEGLFKYVWPFCYHQIYQIISNALF